MQNKPQSSTSSASNTNGRDSSFTFENVFKLSFPLIIILGVTRLTAYYYQFNVPIIDYLEITDVTTLFLYDIVYYLFFLAPLMVLDRKFGFIGIMVVLTLAFVIHYINQEPQYGSNVVWILPFAMLVISIVLRLAKYWQVKYNMDFSISDLIQWTGFVVLFVITLAFTSFISYRNSEYVKNYCVYQGTAMDFEAFSLVSDSSVYYIGKTKNYIFLFNAKQKSPIVYPIAEVKRITIHIVKPAKSGGNRPTRPPRSMGG